QASNPQTKDRRRSDDSIVHIGTAPRFLVYATVYSNILGIILGVCATGSGGGFLLREFGITVVTRDGREAGVGTAFLRNWITWTGNIFVLSLALLLVLSSWKIGLITLFLLVCLLAYSTLVSPDRGLQDRILGTYLVPSLRSSDPRSPFNR